jgi:hypothetical protein
LARGEELADYNLVDFFVNTYEVDIGKHAEPEPDSEDIGDSRRRPGRPKGVRVKYLTSHEAHNKKQRVIRSRGHNTFPNFIGSSFPRRDDPEIREFYCACMLMLLKPWRDLKTDLKRSVESWEHAFDTFTVTAPKRIHDILSNIQYFHSCRSAAMASRDPDDDDGLNEKSCTDFRETEELGEDVENTNPAQSEEGLAELIASQVPLREDLHARMAVELARAAKIFPNDSSDWELSLDQPVVATATGNDLSNLIKWRVQLAKDVQEQNSIPEFVQAVDPIDGGEDVVRMDDLTVGGGDPQVSPLSQPAVTDIVLSPAHPSELKADQLRAYEIIVWHLDQVLAGKNPPPLRMLLHGEGGTGKSKVIQTVTQAFVDRAVSHWLLKAAYTGVAASLINGKTTHIIGGISIKNGELSDEAKANLQKFWQHFRYLILDETSMLAKEFFALLSRNISIAKGGTSSHSFGGVNLIICGDFHQFPPVATGLSEVLYYPIDLLRDSLESKLGHMICEEFSTVVILKEQMRVITVVCHRSQLF